MAKRRVVESGDEGEVAAPAIAEVEKRPKLSGNVTVACKIPQGMRLQLQHKQRTLVPTGLTGRSNAYKWEESLVYGGPVYHVFGPSMPAQGGQPDGYILPHALEGGYALTRGIPAAFWATWMEQHKRADYVTNKMIFAYDEASVKAKPRGHAELTSGIQPVSREIDAQGRLKDRRVPKPITANVARVGFDAERSAERTSGSE